MIELSEHSSGTHALPAVPVADQVRLAESLGNRLTVKWLSNDRVEVRSASWVGSVRLSSELHVRVVPKLAGGNLGVLTMLALTDGSPIKELPDYLRDLSDDSTEDAVQLLCRLVVVQTERVLARGLIRDYRGHADDLPFLRGRLDTYRQATVHYGKFTALACTFDEFDHDALENHLLLAGVMAARRAAQNPQVRRRAADLEQRLAQIAPTLPSPRTLLAARVVYGRRNAHYRSAHTWCRSLLRLGEVDDSAAPDSHQVGAFLINMNALFERFVERVLDVAYVNSGVTLQAQQRNPSLITVNGQSRRSIAPDIVATHADRQCAIDAKYKLYDRWDISPADIYQLLLYAQCYTGFTETPTSYLIYPAESSQTSPTRIELTVPGENGPRRVRINAIGIPLASVVAGIRTGDLTALTDATKYLQQILPASGSMLAHTSRQRAGPMPGRSLS
ncbi:hypothetical protein V1Y59_18355 [Gordonia sp. PKS22-38]|uniref:5-methylcytosine-specific restriction enzyme subunit McrC n=1 Tax=Gordonia prachuapensis TaxID=3115651 RepID=A0ABU7MXI9_9ACTN|nr:hypothetical protein [Gordonia sp. PKS22-38]